MMTGALPAGAGVLRSTVGAADGVVDVDVSV
jgi:hypothetical protein